MRIESMRIRNYRALKDVELSGLSGLNVFVGANGTGKSTLFDVFGFLHDALVHNVRQALAKRGGFSEVVSRGEEGPISIELKFRQEPDSPLVTYSLQVGFEDNAPFVEREVLKYRRGQHGKPWHFLDFSRGEGNAVVNEEEYAAADDAEERREPQKLDSPDILAIKGLGQFQRFDAVLKFRRMIESWHVSDFHIAEARPSQEAGFAEHLSARGDNLPLVAQYLFEQHRPVFDTVLEKMASRVPGVEKVEAVDTADGRLVLRFQDGSFKDPFIARFVSDGTIKMFAYLVLLHDPKPHPLLCVEEPENQLYPKLLVELSEEFREYSNRGGQVFVSSHSPDLLNGLALEEVYWLKKVDGFASVKSAAEDDQIKALVGEGDQLGALWRQGLFDGVHPE